MQKNYVIKKMKRNEGIYENLMKCNKVLCTISHIFTTSTYSKTLSIFSNSSSKSTFILINYTKLKKDLKPTLGSLGQFFLAIFSSNSLIVTWHLLRLISIWKLWINYFLSQIKILQCLRLEQEN